MKTGSSSIQAWLSREAPRLAAAGCYVPTSMGPNMSRLAAISEASVLGLEPTSGDTERFRQLKIELDAIDDTIHTIVISGEMLGHQLRRPEQLEFIRTFLTPYASAFSVYMYLRRQDEISVSRYSTALRRGERRARPLSTAFEYDKALDLWSGVFGSENVHPRLYDRASLIGGDVIHDFAEAASLPFDPTGRKLPDQNTSIRPEAQSFLAALAARVRDTGYDRPFEGVAGHAVMNRLLSSKYQGTGYLPSRKEVQRFYAQSLEANERVRAQWFPERETLFSEDFSRYPEPAAMPPSSDQILEVALDVLAALVTEPGALGVSARASGYSAQRALNEQMRKERRERKGGMQRKGRKAQAGREP